MKFRKKPVVIEAFQWTGGPDQTEDPEWIVDAIKDCRVVFHNVGLPNCYIAVATFEGVMLAKQGDWIIKGIKGELYPCKPDIFAATYERADAAMTFGAAIKEMQNGAKVEREGWNGKGMFLFLVPGSHFTVNRPPLLGIYPPGTEIDYRPHIDMKTAQGDVVPWVASQSDLLANDWRIVE